MAKVVIPEGKNRYMFTLTTENVEFLQNYLREKRAPKGMLSALLDELISDLRESIESMEALQSKKGKLTIADVFAVTGNILQKKEEPELPYDK